MRRIILQSELENIIKEMLSKGYEGGYWDYKEDYTSCKEDKLIDIICMANNIEGRDAYLIYGADDNGIVKGIETTTEPRYTTKMVTEFLRTKPFAGQYLPKVSVQVLKIDGHELDVLIVHRTNLIQAMIIKRCFCQARFIPELMILIHLEYKQQVLNILNIYGGGDLALI